MHFVYNVAARIQILRRAAALTHRELTQRSGLTRCTLSRLETGRKIPGTISLIEKLCTGLGCSADYLFRPIDDFADEVFRDTPKNHRPAVLGALRQLASDHDDAVAAISEFLRRRPARGATPQPAPSPMRVTAAAYKEAEALLDCALRNGGAPKMRTMIGHSSRERAELLMAFDLACKKRKIKIDSNEYHPDIFSMPSSMCRSQLGAVHRVQR